MIASFFFFLVLKSKGITDQTQYDKKELTCRSHLSGATLIKLTAPSSVPV